MTEAPGSTTYGDLWAWTENFVRAGRDITDRETEFAAAVAPAIATATRLAVRSEARGWTPGGHPAIVVVGPHGELRAVTPAAREWQEASRCSPRSPSVAEASSWRGYDQTVLARTALTWIPSRRHRRHRARPAIYGWSISHRILVPAAG